MIYSKTLFIVNHYNKLTVILLALIKFQIL
jgi:hypothetical protein